MRNDLFSIGEVSKLTGITIKALRFYEKLGLLKPEYVDPNSKYRYYASEQLIRMDIIKAARSMDISPKDIKAMLQKQDMTTLSDFIATQIEKARERIVALSRTLESMDAIKDAIDESKTVSECLDLVIKEIPSRKIHIKRLPDNFSQRDLLQAYSALRQEIDEHRGVPSYESGILYTPCENDDALHPTHLYHTVTAKDQTELPGLISIAQSQFLCVVFNKSNAPDQTVKLNSYLEENQLSPGFILQRELLNNVFNPNEICFEMQVPMTKEACLSSSFL